MHYSSEISDRKFAHTPSEKCLKLIKLITTDQYNTSFASPKMSRVVVLAFKNTHPSTSQRYFTSRCKWRSWVPFQQKQFWRGGKGQQYDPALVKLSVFWTCGVVLSVEAKYLNSLQTEIRDLAPMWSQRLTERDPFRNWNTYNKWILRSI